MAQDLKYDNLTSDKAAVLGRLRHKSLEGFMDLNEYDNKLRTLKMKKLFQDHAIRTTAKRKCFKQSQMIHQVKSQLQVKESVFNFFSSLRWVCFS